MGMGAKKVIPKKVGKTGKHVEAVAFIGRECDRFFVPKFRAVIFDIIFGNNPANNEVRARTEKVWDQLDTAYDVYMIPMATDTPANRMEKKGRVDAEWLSLKVDYVRVVGVQHTGPYTHVGSDHLGDQVLNHGDAKFADGQAMEHKLKVDKTIMRNHTNHQLISEKCSKGRNWQVRALQPLLRRSNEEVEDSLA